MRPGEGAAVGGDSGWLGEGELLIPADDAVDLCREEKKALSTFQTKTAERERERERESERVMRRRHINKRYHERSLKRPPSHVPVIGDVCLQGACTNLGWPSQKA